MQNREQILTYRMLAAAVAAVVAFGLSSFAQASPGAPAAIRINDQPLIDFTSSISANRPAFKIVAGLLVYDRLESNYSRSDEPVPDKDAPDDDALDDDSVKTDDSLDDDSVKTDDSPDDDAPDDDSLEDDSVQTDDALDDDSVKTDDAPDDDAVKTDDSLDDDSLETE